MNWDLSSVDRQKPAVMCDAHVENIRSEGTSVMSAFRPNRVQHWFLWLVAAQFLILYAPTAAWLWDRWTLSVWQHAHGLLILPVVGYLIWTELEDHRGGSESSSAWGFILLVPALVLLVLDTGMHTQLLSAVSLYVALPGLSLLLLGVKRTGAILFPLVFLFFTLPIPLVMTEPIHLALREVATMVSAIIIPRLGIPLYVEGFTLHIPNGLLLVADACSGFSTLYASLAIACLTAYMCPHWPRRALVLLAATPVAIAANIIRVVLLVVLVHWYGVDVLGTHWHTTSGLLTFAIALPVIFWLGHTPARRNA